MKVPIAKIVHWNGARQVIWGNFCVATRRNKSSKSILAELESKCQEDLIDIIRAAFTLAEMCNTINQTIEGDFELRVTQELGE